VTKEEKAAGQRTRGKTLIVEISCDEVFRALGRYLENEIDEGLRLRMREHFKHCNHCRALVSGANNVIQLVGDGRAFDVPEGFGSRLYRKLEEHLAGKKSRD
jgi:Putative zinc-finger